MQKRRIVETDTCWITTRGRYQTSICLILCNLLSTLMFLKSITITHYLSQHISGIERRYNIPFLSIEQLDVFDPYWVLQTSVKNFYKTREDMILAKNRTWKICYKTLTVSPSKDAEALKWAVRAYEPHNSSVVQGKSISVFTRVLSCTGKERKQRGTILESLLQPRKWF